MERSEVQRKQNLFSERVALPAETARQYDCELWVENVGFCKSHNMVFDQESYMDLFLSGGAFYSLVDIGHAHINGWDVPALLRRLSGRIRGIHVHDNDGASDRHLPVFRGNIAWEGVFNALRDLPGDLLEILEYGPDTAWEEILRGIKVLRKKL